MFCLVERNLRCGLGVAGIFVKRSISVVTFLLDCRAEFHKVFGNRLFGFFENVDECSRKTLFVLCEERDGSAVLTGTTSSVAAP